VAGRRAFRHPKDAAAPTPASCDTVAADAKARPGAGAKQDPNALTAAQVASREADFAAAVRERAARKPPTTLATVTIPVVFHVISEDGTRANGNIPTSMINAQMAVLNS
jgi:hypothetical protein